MKRSFYIACIVVLTYVGVSFCEESLSFVDAQDNAYDIVLIALTRGQVSVTRYSLSDFPHQSEQIFSIDLADMNELYDTLTCSSENNNCIIVHSTREGFGDYILNWATMVGIDGTHMMNIVPLNVTLTEQESGATSIKINDDDRALANDVELTVDQQIKSACAFALPATLVDAMCTVQETMSFTEGCRLGVIVACVNNESECAEDTALEDREIEFEEIIDSMLKDGTIKIKEVGPVMARLRTIGSVIFVKCIVAKQAICSWWHTMWNGQQDNNTDEQAAQVQ